MQGQRRHQINDPKSLFPKKKYMRRKENVTEY